MPWKHLGEGPPRQPPGVGPARAFARSSKFLGSIGITVVTSPRCAPAPSSSECKARSRILCRSRIGGPPSRVPPPLARVAFEGGSVHQHIHSHSRLFRPPSHYRASKSHSRPRRGNRHAVGPLQSAGLVGSLQIGSRISAFSRMPRDRGGIARSSLAHPRDLRATARKSSTADSDPSARPDQDRGIGDVEARDGPGGQRECRPCERPRHHIRVNSGLSAPTR